MYCDKGDISFIARERKENSDLNGYRGRAFPLSLASVIFLAVRFLYLYDFPSFPLIILLEPDIPGHALNTGLFFMLFLINKKQLIIEFFNIDFPSHWS